jgi:hypothetical protein
MLVAVLTVRAMKDASSPCAVYQSPRSKTLTVSLSFWGRFLKNFINPPSSSTCGILVNFFAINFIDGIPLTQDGKTSFSEVPDRMK